MLLLGYEYLWYVLLHFQSMCWLSEAIQVLCRPRCKPRAAIISCLVENWVMNVVSGGRWEGDKWASYKCYIDEWLWNASRNMKSPTRNYHTYKFNTSWKKISTDQQSIRMYFLDKSLAAGHWNRFHCNFT